MSYAIRNSLILGIVLLLIGGSGWAYIKYYQQDRIDQLQQEVNSKRTELKEKQQIAAQFETLSKQLENATFFLDNYPKVLYPDNNEDRVFDFLNRLNTGNAYVDFTFTFNDSTQNNDYGIMNMNISGEGFYRYLINFIRKIEYSKPLNKISGLTINPINQLEEYGRVNFSFTLESYYERGQQMGSPSYDIVNATLASLHNPFFPLIRDVKPNEQGLVDIENSELIALSDNRAFLLDQNNVLRIINVGDQVYLGSLSRVSLKDRTATFTLNKGGIIERITMPVEEKLEEDQQ